MAVVRWGVASDAGPIRRRNEDSVLARPTVFAVADGMGGHADGDLASALAVDELEALALQPIVSKEEVTAAIDRANARILEAAKAKGAEGMGTTVTGIAIVAAGGVEHWLVFNVGDSRVYRFEAGELTQITTDHSEVQELIDVGEITPVEAESHEMRNVVTRALGADPAPQVDSWLLPVVGGDRFLVCSDGLFKELGEDEIADVLGSFDTAGSAQELVDRAVHAGGRDNVTVVTVEVEPEGRGDLDEDTLPRLQGVPLNETDDRGELIAEVPLDGR